LEDLLGHPAVAAALVPGVVALVVAFVLARTRWLSLAQAAGFIAAASIAVGWSFESLTSTRKLVWIAAASVVLCAVIEFGAARRRAAIGAVVVAAGTAAVWMAWRLIAQKDAAPAVLSAVLVAGYVAAQVALHLRAGRDPVRASASAMVLGLATGVLAILGASAVLGLLGLAAGTAAGATWFVQLVRNQASPVGLSIAVPTAVAAALAGIGAATTGELAPWTLVPLLAMAPATSFIPDAWPARSRAAVAVIATLVPAAIAVALAWFRIV
jgi:hypothetical protein